MVRPIDIRQTSFRVGEELWKRMEKHLFLLKHVKNERKTKQGWIVEALCEKIEREEGVNIPIEGIVNFFL